MLTVGHSASDAPVQGVHSASTLRQEPGVDALHHAQSAFPEHSSFEGSMLQSKEQFSEAAMQLLDDGHHEQPFDASHWD